MRRYLIGLVALAAFNSPAHADAPIPFRSRELNPTEHETVSEAVVNYVGDHDPEMAAELVDRIRKGLIRKMPTKAPFFQTWNFHAFTRMVGNKTIINERLLSLGGMEIFFKYACKKGGYTPACRMIHYMFRAGIPAQVRNDLFQIILASVLVHEHVHVRQTQVGWHIAGTAAVMLTPLYTRLTGENNFELEAYEEQESFLLTFQGRAETRLQKIVKKIREQESRGPIDQETLRAFSIERGSLEAIRHTIHEMRSIVRYQRSAYQKDGLIHQIPQLAPITVRKNP